MALAPDYRLRIANITAVVSAAVGAVYAIAEATPSPVVVLFLWFGPAIAVILWLQQDANHTGVAAVHDLGLFLWFAWPLVIPWYAWKTRGWSGWRLTVRLFAMISAGQLGWLVAAWGSYGVRYLLWYVRSA